MKSRLKYLFLTIVLIVSTMVEATASSATSRSDLRDKKTNLTLKVMPEDGGSVSGGGLFAAGENIVLKATNKTGFVFVNWTDESGNVIAEQAQIWYVKKDKDEVLTANFVYRPEVPGEPDAPNVKPKHYLILEAMEGGSVSGGGRYEEETEVSISAYPSGGYEFVAWIDEAGDTLSTSSYCTYTMGKTDVKLIAHFRYNPTLPDEPSVPNVRPKHNVVVTAAEGGTVRTSAARPMEGDEVTITATANSGYVFVGWYQGEKFVSAEQSYTFVMGTEDVTYEAKFDYSPTNPNEPAEPVLILNTFYMKAVAGKPGDRVKCTVCFKAIREVADLTFHLRIPQELQLVENTLSATDNVASYTMTHSMEDASTLMVNFNGGRLGKGEYPILTFDVEVPAATAAGKSLTFAFSDIYAAYANGSVSTVLSQEGGLNVCKPGDGDSNGVIDVADLVMARDYLYYGTSVQGFEPVATDLNYNGTVDEQDIELLKEMILEKSL